MRKARMVFAVVGAIFGSVAPTLVFGKSTVTTFDVTNRYTERFADGSDVPPWYHLPFHLAGCVGAGVGAFVGFGEWTRRAAGRTAIGGIAEALIATALYVLEESLWGGLREGLPFWTAGEVVRGACLGAIVGSVGGVVAPLSWAGASLRMFVPHRCSSS